MLKRIISIFAILVIMSSFVTFSFAEPMQRMSLDKALKDSAGWTEMAKNAEFKDGAMIHKPKGESAEVFGYSKEKYQNEILEFDAVFEFVDPTKWQGIMIRTKNPSNLPWKDNETYLIVVTEKQLELQRFSYRSGYLAVAPTPFKNGEKVNIQFGAKNVEAGVELIFKVNGKTVISVIDTDEAAIKNEGYFSVYNANTLKLLPTSRKNEKEAPLIFMPTVSSTAMVGDSAEVTYIYDDIDGADEGKTEISWYRTLANIDGFGKSALAPENYKERYLEKIEGETGKSYTIKAEDVGKYIVCGVKGKAEDNDILADEVLSNTVLVDTIKNSLGAGIFFVNDYPYAVAFEKHEKIDESSVCPFEYGCAFYIPLKYTAKALGYSVEWDAQRGECICIKDGKETRVSIVDEYAMIKNGKMFIKIEKTEQLFGIKSHFEPIFGMGIVSDQNIGLDAYDYRFFYRDLLNEVIK